MTTIDYSPLVVGIKNFAKEHSYLELGRRSGICAPAINRIARKVTKKPYLATWLALHNAAPEFIPSPLISACPQFGNEDNINPDAHAFTLGNKRHKAELAPRLRHMLDQLNLLDDPGLRAIEAMLNALVKI